MIDLAFFNAVEMQKKHHLSLPLSIGFCRRRITWRNLVEVDEETDPAAGRTHPEWKRMLFVKIVHSVSTYIQLLFIKTN